MWGEGEKEQQEVREGTDYGKSGRIFERAITSARTGSGAVMG